MVYAEDLKSLTLNRFVGSSPTPGTSEASRGEHRACARCVWDENAAAMCGKLAAPRGGAQTEAADERPRVAGESLLKMLQSPTWNLIPVKN